MATVNLTEYCEEPANNISAAICAVQSVSEGMALGLCLGMCSCRLGDVECTPIVLCVRTHMSIDLLLDACRSPLRQGHTNPLFLIGSRPKRSRTVCFGMWITFCLALVRRGGDFGDASQNFVELVPHRLFSSLTGCRVYQWIPRCKLCFHWWPCYGCWYLFPHFCGKFKPRYLLGLQVLENPSRFFKMRHIQNDILF